MRSFAFVAAAVFALCGSGCQEDCKTTQWFTPSDTAPAPNLVKLVQKAGTAPDKLVIQAIIYGPTTTTDLYSFSFHLVTGDRLVLNGVWGNPTVGDALTVSGGQSVSASAGHPVTDPDLIHVLVSKQGGGAGNQVTGESAIIVELSADFLSGGSTTFAIASSPPPVVMDSNGAVIGSITFDTETGVATSHSTGDCGYVW